MSQLERGLHPVVIIRSYKAALAEALDIIDRISIPVDTNNEEEMLKLIKTSIGTKFVSRWSDQMCRLALKAVRTVADIDARSGSRGGTVDLKRYARVEKVPGGEIESSRVLDGVMLAKDVTHPKMRRRIESPRILLLDCPLEYKKGESQTNIEISKEEDWNKILEIEENQIRLMCDKIIEFKPDLVFTEKGVSGEWRAQLQLRMSADLRRACRPGAALPAQGEHHCHPARAQERQQPHCACLRRHDCEPG
jgi:T-complex protein 1 subunit gamma